jgi:predicted permease
MPPGLSLWVSHRGWLVVLGAFLIQVVGFGAIYSSSAFSAEIAASLGLDHADANLVMVLSLGLSFLVSAISGALAFGVFALAGPVAEVAIFEAAMGPQIGGAIVAMQHGLNPRLVTLMVGVGIPLSLLTASACFWIIST